jgi:hypothetical protein
MIYLNSVGVQGASPTTKAAPKAKPAETKPTDVETDNVQNFAL